MKKLIVVLLLLLFTLSLYPREDDLSLQQKYDNLLKEYDSLKVKYNDLIDIANGFEDLYNKEKSKKEIVYAQVEEDMKIIANFKKPFIGMNIGTFITLDKNLQIEAFANLRANIYFWKYFTVSPEVYLKLYPEIGGGIGISLGFVIFK